MVVHNLVIKMLYLLFVVSVLNFVRKYNVENLTLFTFKTCAMFPW